MTTMNGLDLNDDTKKADWLGIVASVVCLIHCAAAPLFLVIQPIISGMAIHDHHHHHNEHSYWHYIFLALAFVAVWSSARRTHIVRVKVALWFFLVLFSLGIFLESDHSNLPTFLLYTGSIGLVAAHVYNLRHIQSCSIPH